MKRSRVEAAKYFCRCRSGSWLMVVLCIGWTYGTATLLASPRFIQDDDDELLSMVVDLLTGSDAELRVLALEQVRDELRGPTATTRFAALLPQLAPEVQTSLLIALGARKDAAARDSIIEIYGSSKSESVQTAAVRALGQIGLEADFDLLLEALNSKSEELRDAAAASLIAIQGPAVNSKLGSRIKQTSAPELATRLIQIAVQRRAVDAVLDLLCVAEFGEGSRRSAALQALGQLAGPEKIEHLAEIVVQSKAGAEREAVERTIAAIYNRHPGLSQELKHPLLATFYSLVGDDQAALLPTVGRVGGQEARQVVDWYLKHPYPFIKEVGWKALCQWPDASVAEDLLAEVKRPFDKARRSMALKALIRVSGLPSETYSDAQRLAWLQQAMSLCQDDSERQLVLKRVSAVRNIDSLRFAMSWVEKPGVVHEACQAVVELAHLRWLRDENKDEFMVALDRVQSLSKDPVLLDRAQRYKEGKTWTGSSL